MQLTRAVCLALCALIVGALCGFAFVVFLIVSLVMPPYGGPR